MQLYRSLLSGWTAATSTFDAVSSRIGHTLGNLGSAATRIPRYVIGLLGSLGKKVATRPVSPETLAQIERGDFPALTSLILDSSQITPERLRNIFNQCPNLNCLTFTSRSFIGTLTDAELEKLLAVCPRNLASLTLECNMLTDRGIKAIVRNCPNLISLSLSCHSKVHNARITIEGINELAGLGTLQHLDLSGCNFTYDEIGLDLKLPQLTSLVFFGGSKKNHYKAENIVCPKLTSLVLYGYFDGGVGDFNSLSKLKNIDIQHCKFFPTKTFAGEREQLEEFAEEHTQIFVNGIERMRVSSDKFSTDLRWGRSHLEDF